MERQRCKLCYRKFANGRALGGHMRSHMMNLPIPPKPDPPRPLPPPPKKLQTPSCETVSETESPSSPPFSSSSSSGSERDAVAEPTGSSSLITLQDRESETESFKKNPTRKRRSKRIISKPSSSTTSSEYHFQRRHYRHLNEYDPDDFIINNNNNNSAEEAAAVEAPGSSVSEVTSDEDLAFCLMMMSRDKWNDDCDIGTTRTTTTTRTSNKKRYKCDTCNKVFKSYQALGGHRASHKKQRLRDDGNDRIISYLYEEDERLEEELEKKVHECPVCYRVFASGQALGGHKRSHVLANNNTNSPKKSKKMVITDNESLIDLNLPAPVDDDDDSAVSDVHF
ncbi:hypothetical protein SOVF_137410 [Spinacia oleracea]|uniref:Zinc finger protein ZAT9 n=1 Tax=Spinacia oleracea TaxID=3562 RepID=A0A9R0JWN6_SPIOL|nr:zinc finger protein ZAT9-like [Spinacia oleracea]KNA11201.1 hypothetical protein SOVF_137410 [Spinacia oleracea]